MYLRIGATLPKDVRKRVPPTWHYVGETGDGYLFIQDRDMHLGGFFDIGKMFKRMVTFTPKSFSLKNISGSVGSVLSTISTGGLGPLIAPKAFGAHGSIAKVTGSMVVGGGGLLPSIMPKAFGLDKNEANVVRGITAAAAAAIGATVVGPSLMSMLGPKFSAAASKLGGGLLEKASSGLFQSLMPLAPNKQLEIAQNVTPDQLVQWERTGLAPSSLIPAYYQAVAQSSPPYSQSPYTPQQMQDGTTLTKADMAAGASLDNTALVAIAGVTALVVLFQWGSKGKR